MLGSICREAMKRILFLMYEFEGGIMLVLFLIGKRKQDNIGIVAKYFESLQLIDC